MTQILNSLVTLEFNMTMMIICAILAWGFYAEKLDWLMVYYGCAPKSKKERMPGDRIVTTAWACYLASALLFAVCILCNALRYYMFTSIIHMVILTIFIVMHIVTFIWCINVK